MRVDIVRFSARSLELRCFTEADADLLKPKLQALGFRVTRDANDRRTLFFHAPDFLQHGFTTADQLVTPQAPQRRLTET